MLQLRVAPVNMNCLQLSVENGTTSYCILNNTKKTFILQQQGKDPRIHAAGSIVLSCRANHISEDEELFDFATGDSLECHIQFTGPCQDGHKCVTKRDTNWFVEEAQKHEPTTYFRVLVDQKERGKANIFHFTMSSRRRQTE